MKLKLITAFIGGVLSAAAIIFLARPAVNIAKPQEKQVAWPQKIQLEYANTLLSKGLASQAAWAFQNYIEKSNLDKKELASTCYRLGTIYMDIKAYEQALASFYKAEILDPQAEFTPKMDELIVEALENSGLSRQAQYELSTRSSVAGKEPDKNDTIIARIGKNQITEFQIDEAIAKLPASARENYSSKEGKHQFIKEYVAREVLYDKGRKLGLDKSRYTRERLEDFKKDIMIQQLLQMEAQQNLNITIEDLELYYKANKNRYVIPGAVKLSYLELKTPAADEESLNNLKEGKGIKVEQWIQEGQTSFEGITNVKEVIDNLLKLDKAGVSEALKINDKFYIFLIEDKRERKNLTFNEVKDQIGREYQLKKQQEFLNRYLTKSIEQQEVEILYKAESEDDKNKK